MIAAPHRLLSFCAALGLVAAGDAWAAPGAGAPTRVVSWTLTRGARPGGPDIAVSRPRFTTTLPAADAALELALAAAIDERLAAFRRDVADEPACGGPAAACGTAIDCRVAGARGLRGVSVRCDATPFLGGAHPSKEVFGLTFVLEGPRARRIRLDDLVTGPAARRTLLTRALAAVEAQHGEGLAAMIGTDVLTAPDVPFTLARGELRITFVDLPFAVGPQDAVLRRPELAGLVHPDVLAALD